MRDLTELKRQIDNAEAHAIDRNAPGRNWVQDVWIAECGTYGCLAGNTLLDHGWFQSLTTGIMLPPPEAFSGDMVDEAAKLLGLTDDEARAFFFAANTVGVLRQLLKDLENGDPVDLLAARRYCNREWQDKRDEDLDLPDDDEDEQVAQ